MKSITDRVLQQLSIVRADKKSNERQVAKNEEYVLTLRQHRESLAETAIENLEWFLELLGWERKYEESSDEDKQLSDWLQNVLDGKAAENAIQKTYFPKCVEALREEDLEKLKSAFKEEEPILRKKIGRHAYIFTIKIEMRIRKFEYEARVKKEIYGQNKQENQK